MGDLSKDFSRSEFACKCGCGFADVSPLLVHRLQDVRDILGESLVITSGCRCEKHNKESGGTNPSAHTRGEAVDVQATKSSLRFELVLYGLSFFSRVGIGKDFIHFDVSKTLPQNVMWTYYK